MYDLIIRNAQVFDGLGHPAVRADVAIKQGVVAEIGAVKGQATQEIDAKGLSLMPGIVDLHTHFDAQVTWDRTMSPSPALGVTTVVMGNCGFGIAPCPAPQRETMMKNLSVVEGMDLTSLLTGVNWGFETFKEYMDQLRSIKPYLNTAVFVGHSVVRTAVMGEAGSEKAEPSPQELEAMCQLVREAMAAGSIGFASSFSPNHSGYAGRPMPSTIASEQELMALTGVLGETNKGVFMMATGSRATPEVMEKVAANSGRPAFISTVLSMFNPANPDLALTYYDKTAEMRARGNEVYILTSCQPLSFDFTLAEPYPLISHSAFDGIKNKSKDEIKKVYADPSFRQALRENLKNPKLNQLLKQYRIEAFFSEKGDYLNQLLSSEIPPELLQFLTKVRDIRNNYYLNISGKAVTGGEALRSYGAVPQPGDDAQGMLNKVGGMAKRIDDSIQLKRQLYGLPEINLREGMRTNLAPGQDYTRDDEQTQRRNFASMEEAEAANLEPGTKITINGRNDIAE